MAEEFDLDDFHPFNFLSDHSSHLTDKHLMTPSEVSH